MRHIYLSPHLDDAVLSAGGMIYDLTQAGETVEIWTLMCGDPQLAECSSFADELHQKWGFASAAETVRERRLEDHAAAAWVGASVQHFDNFWDCIYRKNTSGEWLYPKTIFVPPDAGDADYPAQIAAAISARLQPTDSLICQLGLGSHVDHVLMRQAAELLGRPLRYHVDVPYWFYYADQYAAKSAGMNESTVSITEAGLERWIEAVLLYKSQLPVLGDAFDTPQKAEERIRSYWGEREGIRLLQFG